MRSAFDDDELQAWCDARWEQKVAAREAAAARAARRERVEELFEERLKRVPTHQMDPRLAELARGSARPRLELGLLLHRMMERRGFIELGLPTFWAYAKERVSQGTRWANDARRLARVLCDGPGLPLVAGALEQGVISWSMAWLVATYLQKFAGTLGVEASLEAEQRAVLELVRAMTVRKAKELLAKRLEQVRPSVNDGEGGDDTAEVAEAETQPEDEDDEEYRRLERTVPLHEAWLIEDVRLLFNALVHHEANDGLFIDSVVAEAMSSIGMASDENGEALRRIQWDAAKRRILLARDGCDRARKRTEREALAERRFGRLLNEQEEVANGPPAIAPIVWREVPSSARALDAEIQRLCGELELAELDFCTLWVEFDRRGGWRRHGFASRSQYARERLGLSRQAESELRARGQAFRWCPELYDAVKAKRIGLSAARLIYDIATPDTVPSWIDRAEQRTIVLLREEIEAVRMSVRRGLEGNLWPPSDEVIEQARGLERRVLAGEVWTPVHGVLAALEGDADGECGDAGEGDASGGGGVGHGHGHGHGKGYGQGGGHGHGHGGGCSGGEAAPGVVRMSVSEQEAMMEAPTTTYRFVLPVDVAFEFELAERVYEEMVPDTPQRPRPSFLAWACLILYAAHRHEAEASSRQKWGEIYVRDRFRCQNPVCGSRRTVTPHHMKFQAHGGGHEDENLETLCATCHLEMVHERRTLVVEPPASNARWLIGGREAPWLEVVGREVVKRSA